MISRTAILVSCLASYSILQYITGYYNTDVHKEVSEEYLMNATNDQED